jgi:Fe2+ or Zn2+ uptake regulation protein
MTLEMYISCETCSCGSIVEIKVQLDEHGFFHHDFICDNCDNTTEITLRLTKEV